MPKKIKLIINLVFSAVLFLLLFFKLDNTLSNWLWISELWGIDEGALTVSGLLVIFGIYPLILLTALSIWLRGVAAIVLSAVGMCGTFVLYIFEMIVWSIFKALTDTYIGFDPLITILTHAIAFFTLAISIADTVIRRKNKRKGSITQ
ncbi:MAG: hypothetical protein K2N38_05225 [Oscillospiraceae bacterium]|nr:hypothetical protein [Oscillospiraceae bacterium]